MGLKLTAEQAQAIIDIKGGADVYGYFLAKTLREMQSEYPRAHKKYFQITEPQQYKGDGTDQVPYFGAIATVFGIYEASKALVKLGKKEGLKHG